jgi:hypothetical protein
VANQKSVIRVQVSLLNTGMVNLYPVWATPVGALFTDTGNASVTENQAVTITLLAARRATFMGVTGESDVYVGNSAASIIQLKINAVPSNQYAIVGTDIIFADHLKSTDLIEIETSEVITFTLLHDNLPPGLSMSTHGVISGKVGLLPTDGPSLTYSFAVRITDGISVRDRQFTILAVPVAVELEPPGWGNLPSSTVDTEVPSPFSYIPLPATSRGTAYTYQLDLFLPSGVPPTLVLETFIGNEAVGSPFDMFPEGLVLDPHTGLITGSVSTDTPLGQYFFVIKMLDSRGNPITVGTGAHNLVFGIDVAAPFAALEPLRFVIWTTPAGSIATVSEGQVFPIGVRATCTTGEAVTYSLATNTPLPSGLSLNTTTGDIEGVVGHVPANETFTFTIRGKVGETFSDRTFSITVITRYNTASFINVKFKIRTPDSVPMAAYYATVINQDDYFRPTDANFGSISPNALSIFLLGGLGGDNATLETVIRSSPYDAPVRLLLGPHKIAYAKMNNQVVYEVLYREVEDPLLGAGGFTVVNGVPTSAPELYPESLPSDPIYLYPTSIANIRNDFVSRIGFPTNDPSINHNLSLAAGAENLPLWMTSPQVGTDTTTALGYVPAVVIAYLAPTHGQTVLNQIDVRPITAEAVEDTSDPIAAGHEVVFDQYFIEFQTISEATILTDPNSILSTITINGVSYPYYRGTIGTETPTNLAALTTFDSALTLFDQFATSGGKFFRMNR